MSTLRLIIFQMTVLQIVSSQFSGASSGPNTFGYDASSVCGKPYSRNGRAYLEKLPCDFRRQNWCTVAGNFYPWHAVRRFVKENQGLMRRMYGDEKHISVLKSELEKNDIDLEFVEKYRRSFSGEDDEFEFQNDEEDERPSDELQKPDFTNRSPKLKDFTRTQVQPSPLTSSTSISTARPFFLTEIPPAISRTSTVKPLGFTIPTKSSEKYFEDVNQTQDNLGEKISINSTLVLSEIARVKNSSINEIPSEFLITVTENIFNITDIPNNKDFLRETILESDEIFRTSTIATVDRIDENISDQLTDQSENKNDKTYLTREGPQIEKFRLRPGYRPTDVKSETSSSIEEQLFHHGTAAKDQINQKEQPIFKLRGINACPVKEEVVAPFWANNTRGEVLALLNHYPFEQYVHWEKCTHEKKQMYCREGCRCEQQYRLHRLLAYDPNNECRGIFSDWFKFPSCCVCRCYDLPVEFRVTSRSPRTNRQKLKLRSPGNRWA